MIIVIKHKSPSKLISLRPLFLPNPLAIPKLLNSKFSQMNLYLTFAKFFPSSLHYNKILLNTIFSE